MILVDTSVWIDFLRGEVSLYRKALHHLIQEERDICLADICLTEILQGISNNLQFNKTKDYLLGFPIYEPSGIETFIEAAHVYRKCRKQGTSIRSTIDCIIAAIAIENDLELFHKDRDFDIISRYTKLRVHKV